MGRDKKPRKKEDRLIIRRRTCLFCEKPDVIIDYKNLELLEEYMTDRGKITARRVNGNCAKHQRKIAAIIKRARVMALVPFKIDIYR